MKKYYSEKIQKDSEWRKSYMDGITSFIDTFKKKCDNERESYITPVKHALNAEKYRKDFVAMLGYPLTEKRLPARLASDTQVASDGDIEIRRMSFRCFGNVLFSGLYFTNTEIVGKRPLAVCLHGGGGTPEVCGSINLNSDNYNHLARRIVEKGMDVFCPQLLLWDKTIFGGEYDRKDIDCKLKQCGGSVTALEVVFISQTIDYFAERDNIDRENIGIIGLSYGGMYSLFAAAYDTRIKVCYSSSFFNDRLKYSWSDWSYFGMQNKFTDIETAALISPRSLVISVGDNDEMFDCASARSAAEEVEKYYSYQKAEDNFLFYIFEGKHEFDKGDKGLNFFAEHLR